MKHKKLRTLCLIMSFVMIVIAIYQISQTEAIRGMWCIVGAVVMFFLAALCHVRLHGTWYLWQEIPTKSTKGNCHTVCLGGGKRYDVFMLAACANAIQAVDMTTSYLESFLGDRCWSCNSHGRNRFSPMQLLTAYRKLCSWEAVEREHPQWSRHIEKVRLADYKYPILMHDEHVIDGMHRIVHAIVDGVHTLPVRVFEKLPEEAVYREAVA